MMFYFSFGKKPCNTRPSSENIVFSLRSTPTIRNSPCVTQSSQRSGGRPCPHLPLDPSRLRSVAANVNQGRSDPALSVCASQQQTIAIVLVSECRQPHRPVWVMQIIDMCCRRACATNSGARAFHLYTSRTSQKNSRNANLVKVRPLRDGSST